MAFCKSCNATIEWYKTPTGKLMPVDLLPHPNGNMRLDVVNNVATVVQPGTDSPLYKSHFATCPSASQHRNARR